MCQMYRPHKELIERIRFAKSKIECCNKVARGHTRTKTCDEFRKKSVLLPPPISNLILILHLILLRTSPILLPLLLLHITLHHLILVLRSLFRSHRLQHGFLLVGCFHLVESFLLLDESAREGCQQTVRKEERRTEREQRD